jgi:RNA polymerase sigma-70 factor (ECF subfamily)
MLVCSRGLPNEDTKSDQELVAAINRGDWSVFEPLYLRHRDWVYRLACRFAGDHAAALDVVQEAFAYLLSQFPGFRLTAKLTTYLYPVVKNTALAAKRRTRKLKFGEVPEEAAPAVAMPEGELGELLKILPEGQLEVLLMRVVDGMSVEEVATALGLAEGTVKSRLHHALGKLRGDERAKRWFEG